jgi:hypothetical protein
LKLLAVSYLHYLAGLIALALALYYLLSDTLLLGSELGLIAHRPRVTVSAIFAVAAWLLISGAGRTDYFARRVVGYVCIVLGVTTVWLIFRGTEIAVRLKFLGAPAETQPGAHRPRVAETFNFLWAAMTNATQ